MRYLPESPPEVPEVQSRVPPALDGETAARDLVGAKAQDGVTVIARFRRR
jgi:Ni,Fe-hydrogenase III component G